MDNFYDTAKRMQKSAEILHNKGEYHNACYLAGYVVECYAKIIVGLSYPLNYDELKKDFQHDLTKLRKEFQYILAYSSYSRYMVDMRTDFANVLLGVTKWDINKRYIEDSLTWTQANSNNFQSEAQLAMQKLTQMQLDGHPLI